MVLFVMFGFVLVELFVEILKDSLLFFEVECLLSLGVRYDEC